MLLTRDWATTDGASGSVPTQPLLHRLQTEQLNPKLFKCFPSVCDRPYYLCQFLLAYSPRIVNQIETIFNLTRINNILGELAAWLILFHEIYFVDINQLVTLLVCRRCAQRPLVRRLTRRPRPKDHNFNCVYWNWWVCKLINLLNVSIEWIMDIIMDVKCWTHFYSA